MNRNDQHEGREPRPTYAHHLPQQTPLGAQGEAYDEAVTKARRIARRIMLTVVLGSLSLATTVLGVHALRLGHRHVEVTWPVLAGAALMIVGVFAFVEIVGHSQRVPAIIVGVVVLLACLFASVTVMMLHRPGVDVDAYVLLCLTAVLLVILARRDRVMTRWLVKNNEGIGGEDARLAGGFLVANVIMAVLVVIDPTMEIFKRL